MHSHYKKLATTALIYFIFLQLAIRFGLFGPTILDLSDKLNVTQSEMSIVFAITSLGVCIGAISSGFLFKCVPKQIGLAFLLVFLGISVSFVTQIKSFILFLVIQFIIGVTSGAGINACEAWILEIWGEACPPYMQALQMFRGLGYILGPIIVEPFLLKHSEELKLSNITLISTNQSSNGTLFSNEESIDQESRIHIPYMMNGLMTIFGAIILFFQFLNTMRKSKSVTITTVSKAVSKEENIPKNEYFKYRRYSTAVMERQHSQQSRDIEEEQSMESKRSDQIFSWTIIILCSLFYLFFFEEVVVTYLASFSANIDLHLSESRGAFLTSMFNLANVIGKGISIVCSLKLRHFTMLYMNLSIILCSLVVLMIYSNTSLAMLWFGFILLGVGLSSIIASLYALMESVISMDPMVCGILNMSGTLGSVFVPLAIGSFIETFPLSLIIASLVCSVSCLVLMVVINILVVCRQNKEEQFQQEKKRHQDCKLNVVNSNQNGMVVNNLKNNNLANNVLYIIKA